MNSIGKLTTDYTLNGTLNYPLPEDGIDTSDATAIEENILENKTAYVKGKKITGSMTNHEEVEIEPSAIEDVIIEERYYKSGLIKQVTAEIDENIKPENIKNTIEILGVVGTYSPSELGGLDTMDATATAADIVKGKTAYAKEQKITGVIEEIPSDTFIDSPVDEKSTIDNLIVLTKNFIEDTLMRAGSKQNISISSEELARYIGLYNYMLVQGNTVLGISGTAQEGIDTTDADATENDIMMDKTAYVNGERIVGTISTETGLVPINSSTRYVEDVDGNYFAIDMNYDTNRLIASTENPDKKLTYKISESKLANLIGLTSDKIKAGETVLGIIGSYTGN